MTSAEAHKEVSTVLKAKTWFTGEVIRICSCEGTSLPIYTDGVGQYAHCPTCKNTWDLSELGDIPF